MQTAKEVIKSMHRMEKRLIKKYPSEFEGTRTICRSILDKSFNFRAYWEECELNTGRRLNEREAWLELCYDMGREANRMAGVEEE